MTELLIGCGNSRVRKIAWDDRTEWSALTTMDHDPNCGADIVHDLNEPWPLDDDSFDEVHAYEVLEHLGQQGDAKAFFATFAEIWRVLKPGGHLIATTPSLTSRWLWGDPSHTRYIGPESIVFLDQAQYAAQVGKNAMSDFRWLWKGDFEPVAADDNGERYSFALMAHKPVRRF